MIDIVLATYNGEPFIRDQIDSLLLQSFKDWRVIVRDDGSSDSTLKIVKEYAKSDPERFVVICDNRQAGTASANFGLLLMETTAPYVMCCDQDDVWRPDKIAVTLAAAQAVEQASGARTPVLVHTDLIVTNEHLLTIAPSFWAFQNLEVEAFTFPRALVHNVVTGCAMLVNRALLDRALPVPPEALMHDHWLAIVAAAFGKVVAVHEPMMYYRQHGRNSLGARRYDLRYVWRKILSPTQGREDVHFLMKQLAAQAQIFTERFPDAGQSTRIARALADLPSASAFEKRTTVVRHGFWKSGLSRNIGWFLRL